MYLVFRDAVLRLVEVAAKCFSVDPDEDGVEEFGPDPRVGQSAPVPRERPPRQLPEAAESPPDQLGLNKGDWELVRKNNRVTFQCRSMILPPIKKK